jgi:hypothetical protein
MFISRPKSLLLLREIPITNKKWDIISRIDSLLNIEIHGENHITKNSCKILAKSKTITSVCVDYTDVTKENFKYLLKLKSSKSLKYLIFYDYSEGDNDENKNEVENKNGNDVKDKNILDIDSKFINELFKYNKSISCCVFALSKSTSRIMKKNPFQSYFLRKIIKRKFFC